MLSWIICFFVFKPLENEEKKAKFANVKPLEMRAFEILEHFRNVSSFGFSDPRSSKYPRSLRLFSISHLYGNSGKRFKSINAR